MEHGSIPTHTAFTDRLFGLITGTADRLDGVETALGGLGDRLFAENLLAPSDSVNSKGPAGPLGVANNLTDLLERLSSQSSRLLAIAHALNARI